MALEPSGKEDIAAALIAESQLPFSEREKQFVREALRQGGDWSTVSAVYSARILERALVRHAEAMNRAAAASDSQASGLKWATVALVLATIGLGIASLIGPALRIGG